MTNKIKERAAIILGSSNSSSRLLNLEDRMTRLIHHIVQKELEQKRWQGAIEKVLLNQSLSAKDESELLKLINEKSRGIIITGNLAIRDRGEC